MKISVSNFKAIKTLDLFPIEKINILAGVNSGGKSSLIQLLLLLKQSIDARSAESPLKLNRPYISLGKFENILRKGAGEDALSFTILLDSKELPGFLRRIKVPMDKSSSSARTISQVSISASFKRSADRIVVQRFSIELVGEHETAYLALERNHHGKSYSLDTNAFGWFFQTDEMPMKLRRESVQVVFFSFFPDYISSGEDEYYGSRLIDQSRIALQRIFSRISYLGPLREEPRDFYFQDDDQIEHIGNKGENAAYILAKHSKDKTRYLRYSIDSNGIPTYQQDIGTLEEAVNHWMCDVFQLGKQIRVETSKGNRYLYTVSLTGRDGIKVPITHVGFGVSQIFPILVEGLRPGPDGRLVILEQPEIHLHPRVQSLLFDFVYSVSSNVSFLIETHSDHLITRLRRRIAESHSDEIVHNLNLTFVEPVIGGVDYVRLGISDTGSLARWPDGFFDQYDADMRALVRAQANKRIAKRN